MIQVLSPVPRLLPELTHRLGPAHSMEEDVQGQDWLKGLMELKQLRALSVRGCDIGNATMSKIAARYSCLGSVDVSKTAVCIHAYTPRNDRSQGWGRT